MPRKNLNKYFICPFDKQRKPWGDLVKHIAYSKDPEHRQWRISHDLPEDIPFGSLNKYEPKLRIAMVNDFAQG